MPTNRSTRSQSSVPRAIPASDPCPLRGPVQRCLRQKNGAHYSDHVFVCISQGSQGIYMAGMSCCICARRAQVGRSPGAADGWGPAVCFALDFWQLALDASASAGFEFFDAGFALDNPAQSRQLAVALDASASAGFEFFDAGFALDNPAQRKQSVGLNWFKAV
eukprot:CAMPEP_0174386492 /NCGR_PEP_ID=MMETSP0811_2-20130205/127313_1 /TAXON_ID=73025 ORGANISM="Eutreptiella gymnastica-like, Strain CCMP1594" /NCGR_SAMPLE_ID=MMETSP0811_2 /ASSEMBLY_ACC=CAM_ASM_000667 /LENGTH=162 /DNA_ID=CAMNT_0015541189 /DNA_START=1157 /DNA_END=1646 /DNA_ORIENTATION=-